MREIKPRALASLALFSPNLEFLYLSDLLRHLPFETLFCEYQKDKFVHMNFAKRCLGELSFYRELAGGKKETIDRLRVLDFNTAQGKPMRDLVTTGGEDFISFHHRLLESYAGRKFEIHDFSDWFRGASSFDPAHPYLRYLGSFLVHGILFGNFSMEKREKEFTETRVLPAIKRLEELFGVAPLIVPIEPSESDDQLCWCYYPEEVKNLV
jgi:hypothetical protein